MTAAATPPWPGSRVLLGWWRDLAGRQPQQLWFSRFLLHRVEALVQVTHTRALDFWQRALLRLISTRAPSAGGPDGLLADLQIDRQILTQLVRELTDAGLLQADGADRWGLTTKGRHALESGSLPLASQERRVFCFVDNAATQTPAHFLPMRPSSSRVAPVLALHIADCSFDVACLEACVRQTPEWKARHHFPRDVEALLPAHPGEPLAANWPRVILDCPEQVALVFIRVAASAGDPVVLGFPVRTEGWALEREPVLALTEGWQEALPDLAEEPPLDAWRQAWQTWAQPRGLPPAEVDVCRLERCDCRLLVRAPHRLIERLHAARSDAIKQEAWLLAGGGRTRAAALVVLEPL